MATQEYLGRKSRVAMRYKAGFGSTVDLDAADAANIILLVDPAGLKKSPAVVREELQLTSATGLTPERARSFTDTKSGLHRFSFSGPAIRDSLPHLLFLALFKATETDLTVPNPDNFQQVFVPWTDSLTYAPDFTDAFDPASSASTNVKLPSVNLIYDYLTTAAGGSVLNDAILDNLNIDIAVNNSGVARFVQVSGDFVGAAYEENFDSTSISYGTAPEIVTYNNASAFTFSLAGTVSYTGVFKSYRLSIQNKVTSDTKTTGGRATNLRITPSFMVDFSIPVNETTAALRNGLVAGTEQTVTLTTGTTSTLGYLSIVAKGVLVGDVEPVLENGIWTYKGQLQCELPSSGNSLTVSICSLTQLLVTP